MFQKQCRSISAGFDFFYFPENYSRRVCKSSNKKILAKVHLLIIVGTLIEIWEKCSK